MDKPKILPVAWSSSAACASRASKVEVAVLAASEAGAAIVVGTAAAIGVDAGGISYLVATRVIGFKPSLAYSRQYKCRSPRSNICLPSTTGDASKPSSS